MVVTPGSLAGYTYFPPSSSGGSGSGSGEEVSTLQRCTFTPATGDQTVTVRTDLLFGYTKPIPLNFVAVGGDGGYGVAAGGGGSSAILLNGTPQIIAAGANGGSIAVEQRGRFNIKGGDTIRFVTGGGGGGGVEYTDNRGNQFTIGGGGGAGFKGGGAGASHNSSVIPAGGDNAAHGRGGTANHGQGGQIVGGVNGTSGRDLEGGVSTFPDGSIVTNGSSAPGNAWYGFTGMGWLWDSYRMGNLNPANAYINPGVPWKFSATGSRQGSPSQHRSIFANGSCFAVGGCWTAIINRTSTPFPNNTGMYYAVGGGGGALGRAGVPFKHGYQVDCACFGSLGGAGFDATATPNQPVVAGGNLFNQSPQTSGASIGTMAPPTSDMNLTRPTSGAVQGANPGQIIVQYQAPVCGLLQ